MVQRSVNRRTVYFNNQMKRVLAVLLSVFTLIALVSFRFTVAAASCPTGFDFIAGSSTVCEKRITTSQTWTVPVGVTSVDVVLVGGGGGGGGSGGNNAAGGGGGGGGQTRTITNLSLVGIGQIEVTVGDGGLGGSGGPGTPGQPGVAGFAGSQGGTTSIVLQPTSISYEATGGSAGGGATATQLGGAAGAGGTGGVGAANGGSGGKGGDVSPSAARRGGSGAAGPTAPAAGLFDGNTERFGGGGGGGGALRGAVGIGAGGAGGGGAGGAEVPLTTPPTPGNPGNPGSAPGGGGGGGTGPNGDAVAGGGGGQGADGVAILRTTALSSALTPTFDAPVSTLDGFTVNVTNYDANFTWTATTTIGTVTIGDPLGTSLPLIVTDLSPGTSATITVTTNRVGYTTGSAGVTASAEDGNALIPSFDVLIPTVDGFTVNVTNYDANFTWTATTTIGTVTIGDPLGTSLPLAITGLSPGASTTLTVVTQRSDYRNGAANLVGQARRSTDDTIAPPRPTPQTVAFDPGTGNFCHSGEITALTGTWINLPTASSCVGDPARGASVLLGWATTPTFPIELARRQVLNGWGAYEIFDENDQLSAVFIPAGGAALISSDGALYAIWGT